MSALSRVCNWTTFRQLFYYGIVGIAQNSVGYGIYILFTWLGADPKLVVAIAYPIAMLVSFLGNKKYTFHAHGKIGPAGVRFLMAHLFSYGINLGMLYVFVDKLGWRHELVQAAAIFVCAAFLFVALKFYVFRSSTERSNAAHPTTAA